MFQDQEASLYLLYPLMPPKLSWRRFPTHSVSEYPDFLFLPFLIGTLFVHFHHCSYDLGRPEYRSHYSNSLRAGRSGDRIPIRARFSSPVQYGYEGQLSSRKTGTRSVPGVKRPRSAADHPTISVSEVSNVLDLHFRLPSVPAQG